MMENMNGACMWHQNQVFGLPNSYMLVGPMCLMYVVENIAVANIKFAFIQCHEINILFHLRDGNGEKLKIIII